jgi:hypothetical protein
VSGVGATVRAQFCFHSSLRIEEEHMYQSDLDRAVALATGESLTEIRRRGFGLTDPFEPDIDPEPIELPRTVDWDELQSGRFRVRP